LTMSDPNDAPKPLKLAQQLVMTPQLQMAIRLLGMPLAQLRDDLPELVASNPPLEVRARSATPIGPFSAAIDGPVVPELFVWREEQTMRVVANDGPYPTFSVYGHDLPLMLDPSTDAESEPLQGHTAEEVAFARNALWLCRALQQRARTYVKLGQALVTAFGPAVFVDATTEQPRIKTRDIAERMGMHESTVTRMVGSKQTLRSERGDVALSDLVGNKR
jgi:DNA-directed RNA polymerase specialized sigma54-like protein